MSHAALQTDRPAQHARPDAATTTQRWAIGVLAVSTVLLLADLALLVVGAWLLASGWNVVTTGQPATVDVLAILADVAPSLLVGWCTGLAASAVLTGGEALGTRTAGLAAGAVGTTAGAAVLALTGIL
jgi:hypothetical protein